MKALACLPLLVMFPASGVRAAPGPDDGRASGWLSVLPATCAQFAPPGPNAEHPMYWDRRLSLATCLADATTPRVESPFDVGPMFADLSFALTPAMVIWRDALDRAPPTTQLRAAYHVGLVAVALMTRARSSLVAPATMTKLETAERERVLRGRLEPLLISTKKLARSAFTVIDDVARENPEFEDDPVHRSMVRSARMMLRAFEPLESPRRLSGAVHTVRANH